jgi:8-oxo-dGTP diphosphatase
VADDPLGALDVEYDVPLYALSAVVYAERGGEILLLKRTAGAMSGQWFLPGGAVERGERPEVAAQRELFEESGLELAEELELVGAYPIWLYGRDFLQLSYRARVRDGDLTVSHEHDGAYWIDAAQMRENMNDAVIERLAAGNDIVAAMVRHIRDDLDRYLRRVGRS